MQAPQTYGDHIGNSVLYIYHATADQDVYKVPQFALDFDLDSEHGLDSAPTERPANIGYGIAGLEEGSGAADGQGIALVVDAEVCKLKL